MEREMTIRDIYRLLKENWIYIVATPIIFCVLALGITQLSKPDNTSLHVVNTEIYIDQVDPTGLAQKTGIVETTKAYILSSKMMKTVKNNLDLDLEAPVDISVFSQANSQIITLTIKNNKKHLAYKISDEITSLLRDEATPLLKLDNFQILDQNYKNGINTSLSMQSIKVISVFAFILGIFVSTGVIFIINHFNTTVKTRSEFEKLIQLQVLGTVPNQLSK